MLLPTSKAVASATPASAQRQSTASPIRAPVGHTSFNSRPVAPKTGTSPKSGTSPVQSRRFRYVSCLSTMGFVTGDQSKDIQASETAESDTLTGQTGTFTFFSAEGTNEQLDLILSFIDKNNYELAPVDTTNFKRSEWKANGEVEGSQWTGTAPIPVGARSDLIVLRVRPGGNDTAEYINQIEISGDNGYYTRMAPNTWIHRSNGGRIFFSSDISIITNDTPAALRPWRQADLDAIQGSLQERAVGRSDWDRIYDYDVYNDLADPKEDRPILGGSEKFPYPRRIRTGRARVPSVNNPNTTYETRKGTFFVPLNEKFNTRKQVNFTTYSVLAVIPRVVQALRNGILRGQNDPTTFKEVDKLYAVLAKPETTLSDEEITTITEDKRNWWLFFPRLTAIINPVKVITGMVGGGVKNLLKFPPPLVWENRKDMWPKDEEWGRQALAGVNPCMINAVTRDNLNVAFNNGTITEAHLKDSLEGNTLDSLLNQADSDPRLLFIDYRPVFEQYAKKITNGPGPNVGYSGCAVLYRRNDEQWVPVAIELKESGEKTTVYTPKDEPAVWLLARGVFTSLDAGYHQLITHWLRTHACTEPYIISMRRNLSELHPVFKLLAPHTAFTMQINANARSSLIAAGAIIEQIFTPGQYAMRMSSEVYKALWRFDREALPEDLIQRGLAKRQEDGSLKLLLKDYPYADDGMLLWNATEKWVKAYLSMYYDDNDGKKQVKNDPELVAWWSEVKYVGHQDKKEGWPELETIDDLTRILTTIIWIVSGHHSAINFSQYPFTGYSPNRPTMVSKKIPAKGSKEYQDLVANGEKVYIETLVGYQNTLTNALTVELLSTHADNEVYIGEENHLYITESKALDLYKSFTDEIKAIEQTIKQRNKDSSRKMRTGEKVLPYTTLLPTSKPGITNRGVPQSISI